MPRWNASSPSLNSELSPSDVPVAAGPHGAFDFPQLGRAGAPGGQPARLHLLDAPELEQHEDVVQVGWFEEPAPPSRPDHALAIGHVKAAALLGADPAARREDLDRVTDNRAAGAQAQGQVLLRGQPVAGTQGELADQLKDLPGHHLVAGPVGAGRSPFRGVAGGCFPATACQGRTVHVPAYPVLPRHPTAARSERLWSAVIVAWQSEADAIDTTYLTAQNGYKQGISRHNPQADSPEGPR